MSNRLQITLPFRPSPHNRTIDVAVPSLIGATTSGVSVPAALDMTSLNFPTVLQRDLSKRIIKDQFIHPNSFVRELDKLNPQIEFTVIDYRDAWHYAVDQNAGSLDITVYTENGWDALDEFQMAHDKIDEFELLTKAESPAKKAKRTQEKITSHKARLKKDTPEPQQRYGGDHTGMIEQYDRMVSGQMNGIVKYKNRTREEIFEGLAVDKTNRRLRKEQSRLEKYQQQAKDLENSARS